MPRQHTLDAFLGAHLPRKAFPRTVSRESTLSCITLSNDTPSTADVSATASSTPPTSIDGGSNMGTDAKQDVSMDAGRPKRARSGVKTYNENVLSRKTRRATAPAATAAAAAAAAAASTSSDGPDTPMRDLSGKTLVVPSPTKQARDRLVQDSIQALDLGWHVDALPGDKMDMDDQAGKPGAGVKQSKSRSLLRKAGVAMDKTKSVLGKRTREIFDASKTGAKELTRRASTRLLQDKTDSKTTSDEPDAKKRRTSKKTVTISSDVAPRIPSPQPETKSSSSSSSSSKTASSRQRTKRWLAQGLYVGQEQGFDPRFKPGDNSKRAQKARAKKEEKKFNDKYATKRTILPMPMFAGRRLMMEGRRDFKVPFDVFHPLPPGQPKPDEWRKTARNVFVGDAGEYWKVNKKLEYSTCICTPESGCDDDCFNRFMFYECDKNNCNLGGDGDGDDDNNGKLCTNRAFDDLRRRVKAGGKYNVGVEVMKTQNKGYGVRSCRTFEPGQIIVEYTGEIITQDECDHRMRSIYKDNECFYLMVFDQNMIIDATRGSIARFVNHSCEPNCKMVKWTVDGKPRMALFAGDGGIMTGEELTYDYNFDPFSSKNIQECHCGSASCRGVLGPKVKDTAAAATTTTSLSKSSSSSSMLKDGSASAAKRKLKDAVDRGVEEVKNKKRRLSADMTAMLKEKSAERAARAALRADIKSAKSKRVVAAKLIKRKGQPTTATASGILRTSRNADTGRLTVKVGSRSGKRGVAFPANSPTKKKAAAAAAAAAASNGVTSPVKSGRKAKGKGKMMASSPTMTMKTTASSTSSAVRRSVDTVRSNVVRSIKGVTRPAGVGKTIVVVRPSIDDVFEVSDEEEEEEEEAATAAAE